MRPSPHTGQEWMASVARRLDVIERHRHPDGGGGTVQPANPREWFLATAGSSDQPITTDGWNTVAWPTVIADPASMLSSGGIITAQRTGYLRVNATVNVGIGNGSADTNIFVGLYPPDLSATYAVGTQADMAAAALRTNGLAWAVMLDTVIPVTTGQQMIVMAYVNSPGRPKSITGDPNTRLHGEYVDSPLTPTLPVGNSGTWLDFDPHWHSDNDFLIVPGDPPGSINARYKMIAPYTMALRYRFIWGPSGGNGGTGTQAFWLPPGYTTPTSGFEEQTITTKTFMPNSPYGGASSYAWIGAGAHEFYPNSYSAATNAEMVSWSFSPDHPEGWYPNGNAVAQGVIEVAQEW